MLHTILWNPQKVIPSPDQDLACHEVRQAINQGERPSLTICLDAQERERARKAAKHLDSFERIFVFGTGGSSLGGQSLCRLATNSRVEFIDNVDPQTMDHVLRTCNPKTTGAVIISKSGGTLETLSQAYIFTHFMSKTLGQEALKDHIVCLAEDTDNTLRQLSKDLSLPFYALSPQIGGRYCIFSMVGLLPGVLVGLDMDAFCEGAADVLRGFLMQTSPLLSESLSFQWHQMTQGINQHVIMPYSDRLWTFAQWAQQLIGESLGKEGKGVTPIGARGTVDQHSQLQLYMDGPQDKWFTLITCKDQGRGPRIEAPWISPSFSYLQGQSMGDVMRAEHQATLTSLAQAGRPVRELVIDEPDEKALGALMMMNMLDVMLLARMMNENPFDQPAVEGGKIIAKEMLSG